MDRLNEQISRIRKIMGLNESYDGGMLIGYHVTNKSVIDDIARDGFRVGDRRMQGRGFYAFYDRKHAIRYATKDAGDVGTVIVNFYVKNPEYKILYLNMDIARGVLGDGYHLKDQIQNYFERDGGLEYFLEQVRLGYNPDYTMDELLMKLDDIEKNNSEGNQRTLILSMIPMQLNDKLNIVWDGNYGLEYRINDLYRLVPFKYEELVRVGSRFDIIDIEPGYSFIDEVLAKIPDVPENAELRGAIMDSDGTKVELKRLKDKLEGLLDTVRNNRDFERYNNMVDKLSKIGI